MKKQIISAILSLILLPFLLQGQNDYIAHQDMRKIANSFPELEELVVERTGVTKDGIRSVMDQFGSLRKLTVEAQLGEVLIEFKRRHIDCVIMPIGYERGSVWWSGPLELPKKEKKD